MSDRKQRLEAIRDQLTDALEQADVAVKAQIAGQLRQVLRDIDEIPEAEGLSARERFQARVAAANVATPSA